MIDRKYLKNYSDIMMYSMDNFSDETTLILSDFMRSDESLRIVYRIISTKPTEKDLLNEIKKLVPPKKWNDIVQRNKEIAKGD